MSNIAYRTACSAALMAALALPTALLAQNLPKTPKASAAPVCTLQAPADDPAGRRAAPLADALAYLRYLQRLRAATYWGVSCDEFDKNLQTLIRDYENQQRKNQVKPHGAARAL